MDQRLGVWLIGAHGGLATTVMVGVKAIVKGYFDRTGLVTELPEFRALDLLPLDKLVFGGHDVRRLEVYTRALEIARTERTFGPDLLAALKDELAAVSANIRSGTALNCGQVVRAMADQAVADRAESPAAAAERIGRDMAEFQRRHGLRDVVVVNLASTEPPIPRIRAHEQLATFERLLAGDRQRSVSASILYAYAALSRGFPYVNFTPSAGASVPALQELAAQHGVPFYGNDGKTGETLVKTALAPMFLFRNLRVLSWQGYNILGDLDGKVLSDPKNKASKVKSKDQALPRMLRYPVHSRVSIDYVPSLGDWKTAWDFIHFQGFLDTKMSLQFIWQGCDSILAAPLVIDLVRLTEFARRQGEQGPMRHLACFFKDPIGVEEYMLHRQHQMLMDYVARHSGRARGRKASR